MTFSPLTKQAIKTNHYGSRQGKKIKHIVIHHMAAVMTGAGCARYFATTSIPVSSNYTIGYGKNDIVGSVSETNRPYTTANSIDREAITIEVSNSARGGAWPVSNNSMTSLVKLVYDIAKRHGIYPVTYTGNRSGTLLKHEWFTATVCPGPTLGGRFSYIAETVTKMLDGKIDVNSYEYCGENRPGHAEPETIVETTTSDILYGAKFYKDENGTFIPNVTVRVRAGASTKSATVAYYTAGSKIKYDKVYVGNGYVWISYIAASGNRRFVACREYNNGTWGDAWGGFGSKPTSSKTDYVTLDKYENATFIPNTAVNVRERPSTTSNAVALYNAGSRINYDRVYVGNGYVWVSYIGASGNRRYVACRRYTNGVRGDAWGRFV